MKCLYLFHLPVEPVTIVSLVSHGWCIEVLTGVRLRSLCLSSYFSPGEFFVSRKWRSFLLSFRYYHSFLLVRPLSSFHLQSLTLPLLKAGGIWTTVKIIMIKSFSRKPELHWSALVWFLSACVADVLITLTLVFNLVSYPDAMDPILVPLYWSWFAHDS